jgi:hypothetical protein
MAFKNVGGVAPHHFEGLPGPPGPEKTSKCTQKLQARLPSGTQDGQTPNFDEILASGDSLGKREGARRQAPHARSPPPTSKHIHFETMSQLRLRPKSFFVF